MGQPTIIELNGKQYDAVTGALLGESRIKAVPRAVSPANHQGRVVDGFVRSVQPATLKLTAQHAVKASTVRRAPHTAAQQLKAHNPQRSQTLVRRVVHKPEVTMKTKVKTAGPSEIAAKPASEIALPVEKKVAFSQINALRLAHAKHVAKSQHVQRFSKADRAVHTAKHAEPSHHAAAATHITHTAATKPATTHLLTFDKPLRQASDSSALTKAAQSLAAREKRTAMFDKALANATAHEQPAHRASTKRATRRRRAFSIAAGLAAFVVLGSFITYLNMPAIELRVASVHAGFHVTTPSYTPNGYALANGITAASGEASLTYRSGDHNYRITQVASNWDSTTLLDQVVEEQGAPRQTIQAKGRTIYVYPNSAQWVNSGVRYQLTNHADLNTDEIVSVATSM